MEQCHNRLGRLQLRGRHSLIFINLSGNWIKKVTSGDIPRLQVQVGSGNTAQVINDKMYVISQFSNHRVRATIHTLDLNTWIWTIITPNGPQPSLRSNLNSWVYNEKMYNFDGEGEVFNYNISNNTWEWPTQGGECPSPSENNYFSTTIHDKGPSIYDVRKILGFFDPPPLSAFGTDLQY